MIMKVCLESNWTNHIPSALEEGGVEGAKLPMRQKAAGGLRFLQRF